MDLEFQKRLLATYRTEAAEHLNEISRNLLALQEESDDTERQRLLRGAYREFHSLKGAARAVNETSVESICHSCEDILSRVSGRPTLFSSELLDSLREASSLLTRWLQSETQEKAAVSEEEKDRLTVLLDAAKTELPEGQGKAEWREKPRPVRQHDQVPTAPAPAAATVRTPVKRLDAILYGAEEILGARDESARRVERLMVFQETLSEWRREWSRVHAERFVSGIPDMGEGWESGFFETFRRLHSFLDWSQEFCDGLTKDLRSLVQDSIIGQREFESIVDRLLDETKEALMVPFSQELEGLALFVSERVRQVKVEKNARLRIEGGEVELDRRILEAMKDPFIHLLNNAIDHGIEGAAERERAGKPPEGSICLSITPLGDGTVEVVVSDDGRGISIQNLRERAIAAGLTDELAVAGLPLDRLLDFVFEPDFSTLSGVSEMSGRGIGLAIVREKAERIGGHVSVSSKEGEGTSFRIVLPLTLARFRAIELFCGNRTFLLQTSKVGAVARVGRGDVRPVKGQETVVHGGMTLPLFSLEALLGLPGKPRGEQVKYVVIKAPRGDFALAVDEIGDEKEIVMKSLGPQLRNVRHIAGASIMDSGRLAPVLDVADLAKTVAGGGLLPRLRREEVAAPRQRTVLVVEDSLTARSLLRNILEGSGYAVVTARDGADGLAIAQTRNFDLILTDVEMPGVDGIELTRQIKTDERLKDTPVIILTALASREDKKRGMEAGADAYVVKSSFDQSDLLATMGELLRHD